ncbi:MAG: hypothetical protein L6R41_000314 [Letrouitia leprolyta]|nr:MAG: hypothetical protein L6R41_000314 [Letrouitia leprolyta]
MRKSVTANSKDREHPSVSHTTLHLPIMSSLTNPPHSSVLLNSTCPYPERYRYRLPRSAKSIEFSSWGAEFPIFDDVADMLDKAENDLTEDIKAQGWDRPIRRIRTWTFESARLVVRNDEGGNGVNHRDLITFLRGLGDFGMVHGFWACKMVFWDTYYSVDRRGVAEISVHAGPRDGVATA